MRSRAATRRRGSLPSSSPGHGASGGVWWQARARHCSKRDLFSDTHFAPISARRTRRWQASRKKGGCTADPRRDRGRAPETGGRALCRLAAAARHRLRRAQSVGRGGRAQALPSGRLWPASGNSESIEEAILEKPPKRRLCSVAAPSRPRVRRALMERLGLAAERFWPGMSSLGGLRLCQ